MNNTIDEKWYPVKNYEGLYEVSDKGRVRSLKSGQPKILKPRRTIKGYLQVDLYKNGDRKFCYIHRLVAQTFIPNPDNLPQVNHISEDKENNSVHNLEWCDPKYNINYGNRNQKVADKNSKPVFQFTKDGEFVGEWKSAIDVERNLGYHQSHISSCCTGRLKFAYGFIWKFKD